jgi:hypothetical protein
MNNRFLHLLAMLAVASWLVGANPLYAQNCGFATGLGCTNTDYNNFGANSNNTAATIEYDNFVSAYHATVVREYSGEFKIWGEGRDRTGATSLLTPTVVNGTNFYSSASTPVRLSGTLLKVSQGSMGSGSSTQTIALTTNGLYAWGTEGTVLDGGITSSDVFQKITVNGKADGLPTGVVPTDVKMLFVTYQTVAITTCSGQVYVLSQRTAMRGASGSSTTWTAVTSLSNVVAVRGSASALVALTGSGQLYTWGPNTYLGGSASASSRSTPTLMTTPQSGAIKMIGATSAGSSGSATTYYVLYGDGNLWALGANNLRQLGNFSSTGSNSTNWVQPRYNSATGPLMNNIKWISPNEHDGNGYAGVNVINSNYELYNWGSDDDRMLGRDGSSSVNPGIPGGLSYPTDKILAVETGGHTTMINKLCEAKFGYVGHKYNGSMGDGVNDQEPINTFLFNRTPVIQPCGAETVPEINTVGTLPSTICNTTSLVLNPLPAGGTLSITAGSAIASLNGNTLTFNGAGTVTLSYTVTTSCGSTTSTRTFSPTTCTIYAVSGNIWRDYDGNAINNSEPGTNLGTTATNGLWANLINSAGDVVASVPVGSNGAYSLPTSTTGTYSVRLSNAELGSNINVSTVPASAFTLPGGNVYTGVNRGGTANTGNTTGNITGISVTANVSNQNFGVRLPPVPISGTVFNDSNGNIIQDGGEAGTDGGSTNLTAYLVDGSNNVVSSSDVANNGIYSFPNAVPGTAYSVILSNTPGIAAGSPATAALPTGWVNTGEAFGTNNAAGIGTETATPGVIAVTTPASGTVTGVNFGIQPPPPPPCDVAKSFSRFNSSNTPAGTSYTSDGASGFVVGNISNAILYTNDNTNRLTISQSAVTTDPARPILRFPKRNGNMSYTLGINATALTANPEARTTTYTFENPTKEYVFRVGDLLSESASVYTERVRVTGYDESNNVVYPVFFNLVNGAEIVETNLVRDATPDLNGQAAASFYFTIPVKRVIFAQEGTQNYVLYGIVVCPPKITGTVFNDANGNTVVDNSEEGTSLSESLYVYLVNEAGVIEDSTKVRANGTYDLVPTPGKAYTLRLSNQQHVIGTSPAVNPVVSPGWIFTGENGAGNTGSGDGTPDGILALSAEYLDITQQNFGIQQLPTAGNGTNPAVNQTGSLPVNVPLTTFTNGSASSDPAPGNIASIAITAIPTGAASITVNGVKYGDGGATIPPGGIVIQTDGSGAPIAGTTITVDPISDGATAVTIPFVAIDNAGGRSVNTGSQGTAVLNITAPIGISGVVFNDANGNITQDGGEAGTDGGSTSLTAYLVDGSNNVVSSSEVASNGTYSFPNASPGTSYSIILSNTPGIAAGSPATAALPTGWVNTGEAFGTNNAAGTGTETATPGVIAVTTPATGTITGVNFAVQQTPTADPVTLSNVPNTTFSTTEPTGFPEIDGYQSAVLDNANLAPLSGNDPEDCPSTKCSSGSTFVIETIKSANTKLYYNFGGATGYAEIVPGTPTATITDFDPSKMVIYGSTGSGSSTDPFEFSYRLQDAAGAVSPPATYSVSTSSPLPVILTNFTVKKSEGMATRLDWATTAETNSEKFEVEHSTDAKTWNQLAVIAALGKSNELALYNYTHTNPVAGQNLYRLKMIDLDGTFAYSRIVSLSFDDVAKATFYPNPATDKVKVKLEGATSSDVTKITLFTVDGKVAYTANKLIQGEIDVTNLQSGAYVVTTTLRNGKTQNSKIVIVK